MGFFFIGENFGVSIHLKDVRLDSLVQSFLFFTSIFYLFF